LKSNEKHLKEKRRKNIKAIIGSIILIYYILLVVAIFYFTWDIMEQYTFILSICPVVASIIYLLVNEQTINPLKYLKIQEEHFLFQTYKEFNFDIEEVSENELEISELEAEISEIKKASR